MYYINVKQDKSTHRRSRKMAGYDNYSKSNNAIETEALGNFPLTKAVDIVAQTTGIKKMLLKNIIKSIETSEYHHTSNHYNITYYYNTKNLIAMIEAVKKHNSNFSLESYNWNYLYDEELQEYNEKGEKHTLDMVLTIEEILEDNIKETP